MAWPPPFQPFAPDHLAALAAIPLVVALIPWLARRLLHPRGQARAGLALAAVLVAQEIAKVAIRVYGHGDRLAESLPLNLCGLAALMTAWVLWRQSYRVHEIAYFWGIGGSLPALLTPDLPYGYPHVFYFLFFGGHGLVLVGVVYATAVLDLWPTLRSVGKAALGALALVAVMMPVNALLDANYLYIRAKPEGDTLIDWMGPWPGYVAVMAGVGVIVCLLCYVPLALIGRDRRN